MVAHKLIELTWALPCGCYDPRALAPVLCGDVDSRFAGDGFQFLEMRSDFS